MKITKKRKLIITAAVIIAGSIVTSILTTSQPETPEKTKVHQISELVAEETTIKPVKVEIEANTPTAVQPEPVIVDEESVKVIEQVEALPTPETLVNDTLILYPQDKGYVKGTRACMIKYLNTYPEMMHLSDVTEHLQMVARHIMVGSLTNNQAIRGVSCSEYAYLWAS